jgi:hypothetical protein
MAGLHDLPGDQPIAARFAGHATAGSAIEQAIFRAPFASKITAVEFIADTTITGQATNFFTLNVRNRRTGAATVVPATLAFSGAGVVATAMTPLTIPLSATALDLVLAAGDVISVEKAVTLTGLAMAPGLVVVHLIGT